MKARLVKLAVSLAALGLLVSGTANAALNDPSVGMVMTWACPGDHAKEYVVKVSSYNVIEAAAERGIVRFSERLGE